jgi:prepilin-type N-terminal cleavage/methylation domain-containing protein
MTTQNDKHAGFTLIEVIIAIVMIGVAASMLIGIVGRSVSGIQQPRETLAKAHQLQSTMENIVAYAREVDDVDQLSAAIGAIGTDMNNAFGAYHVSQNEFVIYDGAGVEVAASSNTLLKIAIRGQSGEVLTRLFARD